MADTQDRDASGVNHVSGLTHETLMKSDPIWAALRGEIANLKALVNELKAKHNAAMTKLDADAGVTDTNYAALETVASADSDL